MRTDIDHGQCHAAKTRYSAVPMIEMKGMPAKKEPSRVHSLELLVAWEYRGSLLPALCRAPRQLSPIPGLSMPADL